MDHLQVKEELSRLTSELAVIRARFDCVAPALDRFEAEFTIYLYEMLRLQIALIAERKPEPRRVRVRSISSAKN